MDNSQEKNRKSILKTLNIKHRLLDRGKKKKKKDQLTVATVLHCFSCHYNCHCVPCPVASTLHNNVWYTAVCQKPLLWKLPLTAHHSLSAITYLKSWGFLNTIHCSDLALNWEICTRCSTDTKTNVRVCTDRACSTTRAERYLVKPASLSSHLSSL